jgi:hypothetical protein
MESSIRVHESGSEALADIESAIESVETSLVVSTPAEALSRFESSLRIAASRGVLVLLLLGEAGGTDRDALADTNAIVRVLDGPVPAMGIVDTRIAWAGASALLSREQAPDRTISVAENPDFARMLFAGFQGTYWEKGVETRVPDRQSFPATYDRFQHGVVDATLALREGIDVTATAVGRKAGTDEPIIVEGRVVTSRQSYIYPLTTTIPGQNGLVVEKDDGAAVTLGGEGAFTEDIEVSELTLRRAD